MLVRDSLRRPPVEQVPDAHVVLDALPDAAALTDADGRIVWANQAFQRLFRPADAPAGGRSIAIVAGPYAENGEGRLILDAVRTGTGPIETTGFDREGMPFACQVRISSFEENGTAWRVATFSDQSALQRVRAELVLKAETAFREREILRATCEALEDAAIVVDDAERLVLANGPARKYFGIGGTESQGRSLTDLSLPAAIRGAWFTFLSSSRPASSQTVRVTVAGEQRTFLLRLARTWSTRGVPLASMLVMRDLTSFTGPDRRRFDFIAQVSHELRTPLAAIQGFIATVLADPDLDRELHDEFCTIVHDESQRLSSLVDKLLEVAQLDSGRLVLDRRTIDLGPFLRDSAARVSEEAAAAKMPITLDLPASQVFASADAGRLEAAFGQLLVNAIQHARNPRGLQVELRAENGVARVAVRDWGPGVPPEDIERIFDPFYRVAGAASAAVTSNGLGLSMCRQIIERHGGSIRAEVPADGGLRVVVELPVA